MTTPKQTPWGCVQHSEKLADGIYMVYTASHGGIVLDDKRSRQLEHLKESNWLKSSKYWEEDCDWAVPFVKFQADIKASYPQEEFDLTLLAAKKTVEHYHKNVTL